MAMFLSVEENTMHLHGLIKLKHAQNEWDEFMHHGLTIQKQTRTIVNPSDRSFHMQGGGLLLLLQKWSVNQKTLLQLLHKNIKLSA